MEPTGAEAADRKHVLVLGAGPLGCCVVEGLLRIGVRHIVVVDSSSVTPQDVGYGVFTDADVGVHGCAETLAVRHASDPNIHILALGCDIARLDSWRYDIALSCSRTAEDRLRVNRRAREYRIPLVDGVASGGRGRVQVVLPYGPCLECILPFRDFTPLVPGDPAVVSATADRMMFEVLRIIRGEQDECTAGVVFLDGASDPVVLSLGISSVCPNHRGEKWRS